MCSKMSHDSCSYSYHSPGSPVLVQGKRTSSFASHFKRHYDSFRFENIKPTAESRRGAEI